MVTRDGVAYTLAVTISAGSEELAGEPLRASAVACEASWGEPGAELRELPAGTRVGRYVVEARIGRGAMGTVYAARDPDLDRKVAVKVLHAVELTDAARQKMRARLLREAQAMARLSHPDVIAVYDVGAFGDQLFVAMEYVDGTTLRHWRAARHRRYEEILAVYEQAGSGLAAAHEAGLVHRDFKPDNVLVGRDGRVRVTDFGLARSASRSDAAAPGGDDPTSLSQERSTALTLTRTGALLGTPAYMSPEQLRGGLADARSDVFSYCVAFYEALYGERPFGGSTLRQLQSAIDGGHLRPAPIMTRVPVWLRGVLTRGLSAAPERRYATMRVLLTALREAHATATRRRMAFRVGALASLSAAFAAAVFVRGGPGLGGTHQARVAPAGGNVVVAAPPSRPASPLADPVSAPAAAPSNEAGDAPPAHEAEPRAVRRSYALRAEASAVTAAPAAPAQPVPAAAANPEPSTPPAPGHAPALGKNGAFILE